MPEIEPEVEWQWVRRAKGGGKGYWRRVPYTYKNPTESQAIQRLRMSELSHSLYGARGTEKLPDDRRIPVNAFLASPLLRGLPKVQERVRAQHATQSEIKKDRMLSLRKTVQSK